MEATNAAGVSLFEAIRRFSDPKAWRDLERLLDLGTRSESREKWTEEDWARHDYQVMLKLEVARKRPIEGLAAWHHWMQLTTAFKARLQSGELGVTGYVKPVKVSDQRTTIPADKWRFLEPDFRDSTASGAGMEIVSIIVSSANQVDQTPHDSAADPYRTGLPGRPTIKHLILQELQYRVEKGRHEPTLHAEARALREWAKSEHPKAPPPTARTIENHIRSDYNRLVRPKPTK